MTRGRLRIAVFWAAAALLGAVFLGAARKLPPFGRYGGPYGDLIVARALPERHTPQSVSAVTMDYRGFDTMGEELILFTATAGILLLLRSLGEEEEGPLRDHAPIREAPPPIDALAAFSQPLFPFALLLGVAIVLHGHLTPGGGFQGGVMAASAFLFAYLGGGYTSYRRLAPDRPLEALEAAGAGGFILLGAAGALAGRAFLTNVLPLGRAGDLLSSGTILLLNILVGMEVGAAFLLILSAFFRQTLTFREKGAR